MDFQPSLQRAACAFVIGFIMLMALPAEAGRPLSSSDIDIYKQAFSLMEQKQGSAAVSMAERANDPVLAEVINGLYLGMDESNQSFQVYSTFLSNHSNWPNSILKPIARSAEQRLDPNLPPDDVLVYFAQHAAQSDEGFRRYIAALNATNRASEATQAIRKRWREASLGEREQDSFVRSFSSQLTPGDMFARFDNMLWNGQDEQVKRLYPYLTAGQKKLAEARIALADGAKKAPKLAAAVPPNLQNDPGFVYERVKWRFKQNDPEGALDLIEKMGQPKSHQDDWWKLRNRAVRELLQNGQFKRAYSVALNHGLMKGSEFAEAEFLAGWIALRFLNDPKTALTHFDMLYAETNTPVSLARAAYWGARAREAANDGPGARVWYGRALVYGTSYYGQLAAERLYHDSRISVPAPPLTADAISRFEGSVEAIRITQLDQAGQGRLASNFATALAKSFNQEQDFRLLCNFALTTGHGEMAVRAAKEAAKKKILLPGEGYPLLAAASDLPQEESALVHAFIRQESEFDPYALSSSGAMGLMQMLPSTAKHVANKNSFGDDSPNLYDTRTSLQFGTAYVNELRGNWNNYLPLVIASYNAGPGAVRGWVERMGDPREGRVDIIDWIESIPYSETRNYVQRVLEGLQIYRARLSGGSTMLALESDLHPAQ
jgi:soluble lytic murein transglycosylase